MEILKTIKALQSIGDCKEIDDAVAESAEGGCLMAMHLERENVRIIFMDLLYNMEHYGLEGKDAEHQSCYIAGALDMANAVIEAIGQLGGK